MIHPTLPAGLPTGRTAPPVTLDHELRARAQRWPDRVAVIDDVGSLTAGQLQHRIDACAAGLGHLGVRRGDAITMQLPNWWEAVVLARAALQLGCVLNPVVPIYRERELAFIRGQCAPSVVVVPASFRGTDHVAMQQRVSEETGAWPRIVAVRPGGRVPADVVAFDDLVGPSDLGDDSDGNPVDVAPSAPDDICLLLYTSGTTADPKGVLHSHRTLAYEVSSIIDLFGLGADDHVFMPSPVTHIAGYLFGVLLPALTGATAVLQATWDPADAVDLVEEHDCHFSVGATPFLHGLVREYARRGITSALTAYLCGGAEVPPSLVVEAHEQLGADVVRSYGSSELPTATSGAPGDSLELTSETDGRPIGRVECRLETFDGESGELLLRGPELFCGYLDSSLNDDAFTADGFFRTGDLAVIGTDGAVTIRGRKKDIIVRGGENISAKEIEDILYTHPDIEDVAIVPVPDPVMVERVCAFVVVRQGQRITLEVLAGFLAEHRLARQKYPERLEIVDALPRTASGKVQKFVLRAALAG